MPRIQVIRRDSSVIELDASDISFDYQRAAISHAMPIVATRIGLDMNQTEIGIGVEGILRDDTTAIGGAGASMTWDLSMNGSQNMFAAWSQLDTSWANVRTNSLGAQITFQSTGQINAGLGEDITVKLYDGSPPSNVNATNSIIYVRTDQATSTDDLADKIVTALNAATVKVDGSNATIQSIFTITQSAGQFQTISQEDQSGSGFNGERITINNIVQSVVGNHTVVVSKDEAGQTWNSQFSVTNMTGGTLGKKYSMGDKVQDLLNMANMSVGGAMASPGLAAGSVLEIPNSVSSVDISSLIRVGDMKTVKKYIVGLRVPYESLVTDTTGSQILRQFLVPAGIGTDYSAESNTYDYDPSSTTNNEVTRPNPYLEQGVAIPVLLKTFQPSYSAGDGFWTYKMTFDAVEQLVGL
jgi:hypothetical protein